MSKTIKKICNGISGVFICLVVLLAAVLVGIRAIGLQPFVILSGSMEPTYSVGSLIYVKAVDYKNLEVGDPITFMLDENTVVTHRIIEILVDEEDSETVRFFTQGDANNLPDGVPIHYKNIIGMPVFSIPYLGYVSNYIQTPPGTYVSIAAGAFLLFLTFIPDLFEESGKNEDNQK